jgi:hypothetical protein
LTQLNRCTGALFPVGPRTIAIFSLEGRWMAMTSWS